MVASDIDFCSSAFSPPISFSKLSTSALRYAADSLSLVLPNTCSDMSCNLPGSLAPSVACDANPANWNWATEPSLTAFAICLSVASLPKLASNFNISVADLPLAICLFSLRSETGAFLPKNNL